MSASVIQVQSADDFRSRLSEDLKRVSLIYFWAAWAEPCKQMTEVVLELAQKHPKLLVLQVDAESQDEIAESFDVESVPLFLILQGHTLLARLSGADAVGLAQAVAKYAGTTPAIDAQSHTEKAPAAADTVEEDKETGKELEKRMVDLMTQSRVVLFMKGSPDAPRCGFSRKIVALLRDHSVEFSHFDILTDERVRAGLKVLNDWPTFPQLIVGGEFVGGLDIVQEMVENGEFEEVVKAQ